MALIWYEYGLIGVLFLAILLVFAGGLFGFMRLRVQKWIGGAIGKFMLDMSKQAAEEEGGSSSGSPAGALELGGFKIDVGTIKELLGVLPEIMKAIKMFQSIGLLGGSSGAGGEKNPFL